MGCTSREERKAHHEARARAYLAEQKYAEAKIELLNWVQLAPEDAQAHLELGEVHGKLGEYREALIQYREAVKRAPERLDWRIRLGALELAAGQPDAAFEQAEHALQEDPGNAEALLVRAGARGQRGDVDAQIADLRAASARSPDDVAVLVALAQVLAQQAQDVEAEATLRRVVQLDRSAGPRFLLANFLIDRARIDEGRSVLRELLQSAGSAAERRSAQVVLADAEVRAGNRAAGEKVLEGALESAPDDTELLLRLARLYLQGEDPARAQPLLESYVARKPGELRPLLALASFHQSRGDIEAALAAVDRALKLDPKAEEPRLLRAEYLMELRDQNHAYEPEARELLRAVLAEHPNSAHGQFTAAKLHWLEGDLQAAADALTRVIGLEPSANAYLMRGRIYASLGQRERAREDFTDALRRDPSVDSTRRELAALELAAGSPSAALEALNPLLQANPRDTAAVLLRAEALQSLGRSRDSIELLTRTDFSRAQLRSREVVRAAELYRRASAPDKARALLRGLLTREPQNPEAVELAVALELQDKQAAQARAVLDRALGLAPHSARLLALRGSLAVDLASQGGGQIQVPTAADAESDLRQAIALEPKRAEAHLALARLQRLRGRSEDALAAYAAALEQEPRQTDRILELGGYLQSLGRPEAARDRYEQALAVDSRNVFAKNNLAWTLASLDTPGDGVLERAQTLAQEAVDAMPNEAAFKDTLGYVLLQRDRALAAASVFREAIESFPRPSPERALARYHLALAHERSGELVRAREEVERALDEAASFPGRDQALALRDRLPAARPARSASGRR